MLKRVFAIWIGKLISLFLKYSKLGGGSAAPGLYAMRVDPELIIHLSKNIPQTVVITGTNGKTTTARLLYNYARSQGLKVIRNSTGSNMERGIASKLVTESTIFGTLGVFDLAIWEVDEATVKVIVPKLKPQIIIFLNAARDQLDRYGELDSLIREWRECLVKLDYSPLVLLNGDDAGTYSLKDIKGLTFQAFGTGQKLIKLERNTSHPKLNFKASSIKQQALTGLSFQLSINHELLTIKFPLPGLYHIYDILASFAAGYHLNLLTKKMVHTLSNYSPAFGRVESIKIKDKDCFIFLIKNPLSTTQVLSTIISQMSDKDRLLMALNDNLADGIDVSWIWDAELEQLAHFRGAILASGKRAEDLALRLKYAGVGKNTTIQPDLRKAVNDSLDDLSGKLFILPTYTALLELQKILAKMGVKKRYWEETE